MTDKCVPSSAESPPSSSAHALASVRESRRSAARSVVSCSAWLWLGGGAGLEIEDGIVGVLNTGLTGGGVFSADVWLDGWSGFTMDFRDNELHFCVSGLDLSARGEEPVEACRLAKDETLSENI
jgi:hypothetical protein